MNTTADARPAPSSSYRWIVLFSISFAMFGNYYLYDSIAPVADLLKQHLQFTDEHIGLLYSWYSWGAILFLLAGGVIIDRWGTKKSTLLFGTICAISGFMVIASPNIWVMAAGRFTLGLSAEPLIVAITAAIAKWFKGKELGFALGVNLLIGRMGQIAADWSPTWARGAYAEGWRDPLVIAAYLGLTCIVGGVLYWILEARAESRYNLGEASATDKLVMADVFKFDKAFWYITALCVAFYSAVFPFRSFAIKYFIEAHGAERDFAGQLNSILPIVAMVATPLIGLLVDKIGFRALLMMVGSIFFIPVFLMLAYSNVTLYLPVAMLGISFSLIPAIMWPSVAYLVDQRRLGSAYALMFVLQQAGVSALEWAIGKGNDMAGASAANPGGYLPMMLMLASLGVVGFVFAFLLWRTEKGPQAHGLETITAKG